MKTAQVTYLIAHTSLLSVALDAARLIGMPKSRIILLDEARSTMLEGPHDFFSLVDIGSRNEAPSFQERQLGVGEGNKRIALLCWSSGTTGLPKVSA